MGKWKQKRKKWHDRQARLKKTKKHKKRYNKTLGSINSGPPGKSTYRTISNDKKPVVIQTPPKHFSLVDNPEETMSFFMDFKNEIDRNQYNTRFFVDSQKVEKVTVDALIYLIAILQNDKQNNYMHYSFSGNYPDKEEAKRIYTECGFTDYVHSNMKVLPKSNDRMRIIDGINNNPKSARELCDFVIDTLNKERKDILPLQKVYIELMSNVYFHAYEKNTFLAKKWYMYAEHIDDCVRCIFVDTGYGIAKTVRKNFRERIIESVGMKNDDSRIICSVLSGDFRTATKQEYRGNGLLSVRENVKADIFKEFEVFSGRGRCIIPKNVETDADSAEIISYCYNNTLYGTMYQFVIR